MNVPTAVDLQRLAARRILFGHQSVGVDILRGLAALAAAHPAAALRIADVASAPVDGPCLVHARIGRNGDPRGKTEAFARLLESPGRFDVALHKYCYVDVRPDTDVPAMFDDYAAAFARLVHTHPHIRFVHVTVPLVRIPEGVAAQIRSLVSGPSVQARANRRREEFNARLRDTFATEPIFDLAAIESTMPDGQEFRAGAGGRRALVPAYTTDGGHLNDVGAARAAAALVEVIGRELR